MAEETQQILIKLLDGKHKTLNFTTPSISIPSLKTLIYQLTSIPTHHQLLLSSTHLLHDHETLVFNKPNEPLLPNHSENVPRVERSEVLCHNTLKNGTHSAKFPLIIHLLARIRGGKGGFGSLLRGAATKAGQKKTNNFDACRDMSGRRLRHVNAEKKLEQWKAGEEERHLEKVAEQWIKKKVKEVKREKGSGGGAGGEEGVERYVKKYREDSEKCTEKVEKSVRVLMEGGFRSAMKKRKGGEGEGSGSVAKKIKIWMGKRKMDDSDSDNMDDTDDDRDDENEKSIVIDGGNQSDSNKEPEGSPGSVTGGKLGGESSAGLSSESVSEEEETIGKSSLRSKISPDVDAIHDKDNGVDELPQEVHEERILEDVFVSCLEATVVSGTEAVQVEKQEGNNTEFRHVEETVRQPPSNPNSVNVGVSAEINCNPGSTPVAQEEAVFTSNNAPDVEKSLNFDEFSSAADMEALGMERLKSELQAFGLKCGGTLQERATRLFLLKTSPLEMIPKKLIAKK